MRDVVLGACVGDAVGAPLEFLNCSPIPKDLLLPALQMKSTNKYLDIDHGQITDDGELTICLARALLTHEDPMKLYQEWLASKPVDVGIATRAAIRENKPNPTTEANGALMRCSPIPAFYCSTRTFAQIADIAREDARRTHSSPVCQESAAVYCVAIAHVLLHKNARAAITEARKHTAHETVLGWLDEACIDAPLIMTDHTRNKVGWVKWAFILAFYHLYHQTPYKEAIVDVVQRGGDTDTNAAIVGAMLGALWGMDNIPQMWLHKVCACSVRPPWLRPSQFLTM